MYLTRITFLKNPWQKVFGTVFVPHKNHISLKSMAKGLFGTVCIPPPRSCGEEAQPMMVSIYSLAANRFSSACSLLLVVSHG